MDFQTFIRADVLEGYLADPDWVLVDARFDLTKPEWGLQAYTESHIPGAVFADLNKDLSAPVSAGTGRHPLPSPEQFLASMTALGIGKHQVVVYDTAGGSFAARLWFLLRMYGHERVAILDGDFNTWVAEGHPVEVGMQVRPPEDFQGRPAMERIATSEEVLRRIDQPGALLVDVRSPERYRGESEPIDRIAGRIPMAANRFHAENLTSDGHLKPVPELRSEHADLLGKTDPHEVIVYCGSGVTSCYLLAVMEHIGLPGARLYAGSWSEWIRDPRRPIEKG